MGQHLARTRTLLLLKNPQKRAYPGGPSPGPFSFPRPGYRAVLPVTPRPNSRPRSCLSRSRSGKGQDRTGRNPTSHNPLSCTAASRNNGRSAAAGRSGPDLRTSTSLLACIPGLQKTRYPFRVRGVKVTGKNTGAGKMHTGKQKREGNGRPGGSRMPVCPSRRTSAGRKERPGTPPQSRIYSAVLEGGYMRRWEKIFLQVFPHSRLPSAVGTRTGENREVPAAGNGRSGTGLKYRNFCTKCAPPGNGLPVLRFPPWLPAEKGSFDL